MRHRVGTHTWNTRAHVQTSTAKPYHLRGAGRGRRGSSRAKQIRSCERKRVRTGSDRGPGQWVQLLSTVTDGGGGGIMLQLLLF